MLIQSLCYVYNLSQFNLMEECEESIQHKQMIRKFTNVINICSGASLFGWEEELELRVNTLVEYIINVRRNSIGIIIKFMRKAIDILKEKKRLLKMKILKERIHFINLIQSNFKISLLRKRVKKIIEKEKEYFTVKSNLKNITNLSINVMLDDSLNYKTFHFKFCKIRKCFVLYILKRISQGCTYKVNFVADQKIVIDPMFRTDYDLKGNFFNLIDFKKIEDEEKRKLIEKIRVVNFYKKEIEKQRKLDSEICIKESEYSSCNVNIDSSDEMEITEKMKVDSEKMKNLYSKRHSFNYGHMGLLSRSILNVSSGIRQNRTLTNLMTPPLKSILKSPSSTKTNFNTKRVSFSTTIDFSYK